MSDETSGDDDGAAHRGGLTKPVQEHLGHELRSVYNQMADKPRYLGDPALPPELEHQLVRLETSLEVSENAMAAVKEALDQAVTHEKTVEAVRIALEITLLAPKKE
jgi:hypothetical protein